HEVADVGDRGRPRGEHLQQHYDRRDLDRVIPRTRYGLGHQLLLRDRLRREAATRLTPGYSIPAAQASAGGPDDRPEGHLWSAADVAARRRSGTSDMDLDISVRSTVYLVLSAGPARSSMTTVRASRTPNQKSGGGRDGHIHERCGVT